MWRLALRARSLSLVALLFLFAASALPTRAGTILIVSDVSSFNVTEFDGASGVLVRQLSLPMGVGTGFGNGFNTPTGVAIGPNGALYVADMQFSSNDGIIYKFDPATGAYLGVFAASSALSEPSAITFGPNGDLYVANFNAGSSFISVFDPSGAFVTEFGEAPSGLFGGLDYPEGLAFGPDGNLYVTDGINGVTQFDAAGNLLGIFVPLGSGPGLPANLSNPFGVAFDALGNLYVTDSSIVDQFNSAGTFLGTYVPNSAGLADIASIAFGPGGNLYVANAGAVSQVNGAAVNSFVSFPDVVSPDFLAFSVTSVPEPGTLLMLSLAVFGLAFYRFRRRHPCR